MIFTWFYSVGCNPGYIVYDGTNDLRFNILRTEYITALKQGDDTKKVTKYQ
jgi:hypothetical protein